MQLGWPMMHQGPIQSPDGWPFFRLPLGSFRRTAEYPTANTECPMFKERECSPAAYTSRKNFLRGVF
jgi:hypothetical protein